MALIVPVGAPSPRSVLGYDGADYYVLRVDATGHLQVDVLTSALPAGAATAAHQVTQNTALQLIDNLVNALQSVGTDRLQVRGEDQLFSYAARVMDKSSGAVSGAGGYLDSGAVPAGAVWEITQLCAHDIASATTAHKYHIMVGGVYNNIYTEVAAFAAGAESSLATHLYLAAGEFVRVQFVGSLAGDTCEVFLNGYQMTAE